MRPALTALTALVSLCVVGCAPSSENIASKDEYERGSLQAASDVNRGQYRTLDNIRIIRFKTIEVRSELKRRYGINYELDHSLSSDYVRGYNSVMSAAAKEQFGDDYYENALQAVMPEGYAPSHGARQIEQNRDGKRD